MEPLSADDPATIGEFALHARLGAGGMGQVYLASSPAGRSVAVKVVHPELAHDPEFRQRFSREVAAARAVSGMYTAPVVAAGIDDDLPWLATAFVPGPSLAAVISGHGPLPEPAVWRLAAGLAEALHAVHTCGLIHRDLKPANVLLAADGPHVIDFGISRAFDGTALTSAGTVVGTPGYMSPEQAEGMVVGPESDVFSLGCVLAYATTGNAPFGAGSAAAVLYRVVSADPDLAGVPAQLRRIIESCLKKNPAERTGLTQLSSMISARGPAVPVAPGLFWPDPVASIITADQARSSAAQASPATAQASPTQVAAAPAAAPLSATAGGYRPTVTARGGPRAAGPSAGGPGAAGHAEMMPDGYLSAAASGRQAAPGHPPPPPRPAGRLSAPGPPMADPLPAPTARQPATPPGTPWPQAASATWPQQPTPLARYIPGRRHPTRAETPPAVLAAVRLMYAGAAASLIGVILGVVADRRYDHFAARHAGTHAAARVLTMASDLRLTIVLGGSLGVLCWILLAMACRRGRGWTRPVATVLFGLHVAGLLIDAFGTHSDPAVKAFSLLVWAIGLTTVILLWSGQARQFFLTWQARDQN